jgi:hypothetical protein
MATPVPTITRKDQNTGRHGRVQDLALLGHEIVEAGSSPSHSWVRISEARPGISIGEAVLPRLLVGDGEQDQRRAAFRLPVALHRGDLCGLVLERVQPVQVAHEDLHRDQERAQRHAGLQHRPHLARAVADQPAEGRDARDRKATVRKLASIMWAKR